MKNNKNMPLISIILPTLNNGSILEHFFRKLRSQNYPKNNIEILCVDGGSCDKTIEIAKKYRAKIINNPYVQAEPAVTIGMKHAKGDLIMILAADNYYLEGNALQIIANVFTDKHIFAAFPKHDYEKNYSLFSKYHNVFTDPFNHFVYKDASNARTFSKIYRTVKHNSVFDIYDFHSNSDKPLIALAQGFTVRSTFVRNARDFFDDCMPVIRMINKRKKIAFIHSLSIYHNTIQNLDHFMRKQRWATQNALKRKNYGILYRKLKLSKAQQMRMVLWPIYALSIVFPIINSLYRLAKDQQKLWLIHPFVCWLSAVGSIYQTLLYNVKKVKDFSRQ